MHRIMTGAVIAMLSLLFPTLGFAYGTADTPKVAFTKFTAGVQVAKAKTNGGHSPKGGAALLESLKKARKNKGGGR